MSVPLFIARSRSGSFIFLIHPVSILSVLLLENSRLLEQTPFTAVFALRNRSNAMLIFFIKMCLDCEPFSCLLQTYLFFLFYGFAGALFCNSCAIKILRYSILYFESSSLGSIVRGNEWVVCNVPSLSDHSYIRFNIDTS